MAVRDRAERRYRRRPSSSSSGAASSAVSVSSPILDQMGIGSLSAYRKHGARADDAVVLTVFEKHKVPPWHACRTTVDPYVKVEPWFDRQLRTEDRRVARSALTVVTLVPRNGADDHPRSHLSLCSTSNGTPLSAKMIHRAPISSLLPGLRTSTGRRIDDGWILEEWPRWEMKIILHIHGISGSNEVALGAFLFSRPPLLPSPASPPIFTLLKAPWRSSLPN